MSDVGHDRAAGGVATDELAGALERVCDDLEARLDEVARAFGAHIEAALPGYEIHPGTVEENAWLLAIALRGMRTGTPYGEDDAARIRRHAQVWADYVPLEVMAQGFHVGLRSLVAAIGESARELQLKESALLALQDRAWEFAMLGANAIADVQREHAVRAAQQDTGRRADFLRDLARGRITASRLAVESAAYGLDPALEYYAVCAPMACADGVDLGAGAHRGLGAVVDDRLLAVSPLRPTVTARCSGTVAVGAPRRLNDLHASFQEAEEVLVAAEAFAMTGVVDLIAVGPLMLATATDRLAARLADRYLGDRDAGFAEIEETVLALLDHDQSVEDTAAALHLHRNSVRYRVNRFRELTGLDIRRSSDLVTAWWLLKWRQAHS